MRRRFAGNRRQGPQIGAESPIFIPV
jgi:hypothetical protein